jgi:hypothetical protein
MGDEDVRNYINNQAGSAKPPMRVVRRRVPRATEPPPKEPAGYEAFNATHLFCANCKQAMLVRERLLLFLADGDLFGYSCTGCGASLGTRKTGR